MVESNPENIRETTTNNNNNNNNNIFLLRFVGYNVSYFVFVTSVVMPVCAVNSSSNFCKIDLLILHNISCTRSVKAVHNWD